MRSSANLVLQLTAVAISVALRLMAPGWLFLIFFILVPIGTLALIAQAVTAVCVMKRRVIATTPAVLSVLTAVLAVGCNLLATDGGDGASSIHRPIDLLLGTHLGPWADTTAGLMLFGWFAGIVATAVAMIVTRPRPVYVRPPYGPAYIPQQPYVQQPYVQQPYVQQPYAPAPQSVWVAPHR